MTGVEDFTYDFIRQLYAKIQLAGYAITDYANYQKHYCCCILRHDVDDNLEKALEFSNFERDLGIRSTFFVLLTSDFYNIFSSRSRHILSEILANKSDIGLHFDETAYEFKSNEDYVDAVFKEASILSDVIEREVKVVSMHRPSRNTLEANLAFERDGRKIINSIGFEFFKNFKYISDSRRNWRENPMEIIEKKQNNKLQILTHAFWYHRTNLSARQTIESFLKSKPAENYRIFKENFTRLEDILPPDNYV